MAQLDITSWEALGKRLGCSQCGGADYAVIVDPDSFDIKAIVCVGCSGGVIIQHESLSDKELKASH